MQRKIGKRQRDTQNEIQNKNKNNWDRNRKNKRGEAES